MPAKPEPRGVARVVKDFIAEGGVRRDFALVVGDKCIDWADMGLLYPNPEAVFALQANAINSTLAPLLSAADRMAEALEGNAKWEHRSCYACSEWESHLSDKEKEALSAYRREMAK